MIPFSRPPVRALRRVATTSVLLALGACSSLPASGPTAHAIEAAWQADADFDLVEIDSSVLARLPAMTVPTSELAGLGAVGEADLLGPGDVLQISIYEIGAALFAGRSGQIGESASGPPSAAAETLPPIVIGRDGAISLPWIGRTPAAGRTPDALAAEIARALHGKSQDPQVVVSVRDNVANTVMVMGDVKKPGRLPLSLAGERLLDAVALAGGPSNAVQDSMVRINRGDRSILVPLTAIAAGSPDDLPLRAGDRIAVFYQPRTFTVFGATGKVSETPFETPRVSLAEALARAGGPNDQQADASAVYVFRYQPSAADGTPAAGARPVAYRLDLLKARSYFLAQGFEMKPRDVIYVANARSNQSTKLLQVLNQFFSPIYTAKVLTK